MVGQKPLANIVEKLTSYVKLVGENLRHTIPKKFGINGKNLTAIEKDTVELSSKKFNSQAERLKSFYESKGYPYLLPHQEWSDKKILDTVSVLGKKVDALVDAKLLNKKSLQVVVENIAPELKGKVEIKDFGDLKKDCLNAGRSKEDVKNILKNGDAVTAHNGKDCNVYLKFESLNEGPKGRTSFKALAEHEFKHVLSKLLQNTATTDLFKNEAYKCDGQGLIINKIFNQFENIYNQTICKPEKEITPRRLVKHLGFHSVEDLHHNFEKTLDKLVKKASSTGDLYIGANKKGWKQFFNSLKASAKDEKEAYKSNIRFRELYEDSAAPTDLELKPLLYAEMEKFFAKKATQVNKQIPNK